jgi:hypothetical protein
LLRGGHAWPRDVALIEVTGQAISSSTRSASVAVLVLLCGPAVLVPAAGNGEIF